MKIGIFYNRTQADPTVAESLASEIRAKGESAVIFDEAEKIRDIDRLIVLGGDGTVLHAARRTCQVGIPIIGINFGHLGFLTEFERTEIDEALRLALAKQCATFERTMLEVDLNGESHYCLNEATLLRGVSKESDQRAVRISVTIDGSDAACFTADGLIVSTPTGSTAYSLSAGGSIMMPDCNTFQLTPVCAFSLRSRPIAYPDRCELCFSLPQSCKLVLCGDGIFLGEVGAQDVIKVRKADRTATFLTRKQNDYFRRLTEKIN